MQFRWRFSRRLIRKTLLVIWIQRFLHRSIFSQYSFQKLYFPGELIHLHSDNTVLMIHIFTFSLNLSSWVELARFYGEIHIPGYPEACTSISIHLFSLELTLLRKNLSSLWKSFSTILVIRRQFNRELNQKYGNHS